jgi:hypothetical protein
MSPAEAAAIDLEEPDWRERFEDHCLRWPRLPRYRAEDSAFEATLTDWRRFHSSEDESEGKRRPAPAVEGIIALARLRLFPPRNLIKDIPRDGKLLEEDLGDAHMWLQIAGRAWRIVAIEDKTLILDSFGEQKQIDLSRAKWTAYTEAALAALRAAHGNGGPECHDEAPDSPEGRRC